MLSAQLSYLKVLTVCRRMCKPIYNALALDAVRVPGRADGEFEKERTAMADSVVHSALAHAGLEQLIEKSSER